MPSKKHNELAGCALTWLSNRVTARGMRGTTEVTLAKGYVADAVAICGFQGRFHTAYCKHSGLKPITGHAQYNEKTGEVEHVLSEGTNNYHAVIFEVKISRGDFLSTFNDKEKHLNRHLPVGSLHWCVTPKKLIKPEELPDFWGLLEVRGGGLSEKKKPLIRPISDAKMDSIAHSLIWPLQAGRNYLLCQKCGRWVSKVVCDRCRFRDKKSDPDFDD